MLHISKVRYILHEVWSRNAHMLMIQLMGGL
jgi:hypothetical protein